MDKVTRGVFSLVYPDPVQMKYNNFAKEKIRAGEPANFFAAPATDIFPSGSVPAPDFFTTGSGYCYLFSSGSGYSSWLMITFSKICCPSQTTYVKLQ